MWSEKSATVFMMVRNIEVVDLSSGEISAQQIIAPRVALLSSPLQIAGFICTLNLENGNYFYWKLECCYYCIFQLLVGLLRPEVLECNCELHVKGWSFIFAIISTTTSVHAKLYRGNTSRRCTWEECKDGDRWRSTKHRADDTFFASGNWSGTEKGEFLHMCSCCNGLLPYAAFF